MYFSVTRQIAIDAGHRVMTHGSKCQHIHGHRYTIEAICQSPEGLLHKDGEQTDMVMDFGFLKDEMLRHIDAPCDHGFIASLQDYEVLRMFAPEGRDFTDWRTMLEAAVTEQGYCETKNCRLETKLYVVNFQTTAERLARHWFERLAEPIARRSDGFAELKRVKVWETPNCWADYGT